MEYFIKWIKNLAVFYIIASLLMHIIPGEKYRKYIRLFLGIITIVLLMKPVGTLLRLDEVYDKNFNMNYNLQMEQSLKMELEMVDMLQKQALIGEYTKVIEENIRKYVTELPADFNKADIFIGLDSDKPDFGCITGIDVYIDGPTVISSGDNPSEELVSLEIEKYLANFYNLDKRNINVYIS